jgi:FtsZ-binding cell division protein ZapB
MTKKEKLVDLKPEKITDEQLEKIQTIVSNINRSQMEIGKFETQKHLLTHKVAQIQEELKGLQDELEKQYGTVDINIENGSIKYSEDVEANKKN